MSVTHFFNKFELYISNYILKNCILLLSIHSILVIQYTPILKSIQSIFNIYKYISCVYTYLFSSNLTRDMKNRY